MSKILEEKKNDLITRAEEILESAKTENRELTDDEAMRTIRITLSDDVAYEEIDKVIEEIGKSIKLIET